MIIPRRHGAAVVLASCALFAPVAAGAQAVPADSLFERHVLPMLRRASPELRARRASSAAAEAQITASTARPPAELSVEVENIPDGLNLRVAQQMRTLVSAPLSRGSRPGAARNAAQARAALAIIESALSERAVTARARRAFNGVLFLRRAAARLAAEDALLAEAQTTLRSRLSVGDARYLDVLRLRTERLRVMGDRSLLVAEARERLSLLLGLLGDESPRIAALLDDLVAAGAEPAEHVGDAEPDTTVASAWLAARMDIAQADRTVLTAERGFFLTGLAGIQRFQNANNNFTVGPSLAVSMPLPFSAARSTRNIRDAADRSVDAMAADTAALRAGLAAERQAALERLSAARERSAVFSRAVLVAAEGERQAALAGFRNGVITLLELIDFERALSRAELDRLRALLAASDASADLVLLPAERLLGNYVK